MMSSLLMAATHTASAEPDCNPFPDVDSSNSACANISWLKAQGITKPLDGHYHPTDSVNRGSMVTFLFRLTHPGAKSPTCEAEPFPDVLTSNVFCGYIQWAKDNKITFGYPDGTYRPSAPVTRGAMAAFIHRLARPNESLSNCDPPVNPGTGIPGYFFRDTRSFSTEFCGVIYWMANAGITAGIGDGTNFGPVLPVTRQAMASFLRRLHDYDPSQHTPQCPSVPQIRELSHSVTIGSSVNQITDSDCNDGHIFAEAEMTHWTEQEYTSFFTFDFVDGYWYAGYDK